jgi:hypothetical protein
MGQQFQARIALRSAGGSIIAEWTLASTVAGWAPAATFPGVPPDNVVNGQSVVPAGVVAGTYTVAVSILDQRTGALVNLANDGRATDGRYDIGTIQVVTG